NWNQYILTEYYPNGKLKSIKRFVNGQLNGKAEFWYENGQKAMEFTAANNEVKQLPKVWQMNGKALTNDQKQYFEIVDRYKPNDVKFLELEEEPVTQVTGEGDEYEDMYAKGVYDKVVEAPPASVNVERSFHSDDVFPGGDNGLQEFFRQQMVYPVGDSVNGIQGIVYVKVVVNNEGKLLSCSIADGIPQSVGLETEALRLVSIIPWQTQKKTFTASFTIPINFVLR
ncbi:MAG: TonB family protein, partial [Bacteroidia bacterium]